MTISASTPSAKGPFGWWTTAPRAAKNALVAAFVGWMLDAFNMMLFSMVIVRLQADLHMDAATAGLIMALTLIAAAGGGILFGFIGDRYGRVRALIGSILVYSLFSGASGLSQSVLQLAIFRILLGVGMGGEWGSGAALVSETWPAEHRGKALGLVQSSWAIGFGAAALVTFLVLPAFGWRVVFFVAALSAFFCIWVQRNVEEPELWRSRQQAARATPGRFSDMFRAGLLPLTIAVTLMNACTLFAWWGFNSWVPAYLQISARQGGVGLTTAGMTVLVVVMQVGMWFGYVTFGFISDAFGRKRTYVTFLVAAAFLMLAYAQVRQPLLLLVLGPCLAFFATGYFSGFGAVTAEIYPTSIRATAQGFTYNIGRLASAAAPFTVGRLAAAHGFGLGFSIGAVAFLLSALCWTRIPETRGRQLR